jgi:hypothetical protein
MILGLRWKMKNPRVNLIQRRLEDRRRKSRYFRKGFSGLTKSFAKGTLSTEARKYTTRRKKY